MVLITSLKEVVDPSALRTTTISCLVEDIANQFPFTEAFRANYRRFASRHNLPYILLSDVDGSVRKLYGVASTLGVPGRVTFVINKEGVVVHVFVSQLQFTKHAKEALDALRK